MEEIKFNEVFPGIFTVGNLLCGFLSITESFQGLYTKAAWFIVVGAFLDGLDGVVARVAGSVSQLGTQLDSFADFVTFGLAPAFLLFVLTSSRISHFNWVLPLIYLIASAYRLARYNVMFLLEETKDFLGLPITAAGSFIASFILFQGTIFGDIFIHKYMFPIIIGLSFLMVSRLKYGHFVKRVFSPGFSRTRILLAILIFCLLLYDFRLFLFPILFLYLISGPIDMLIHPPKKGEEESL